MLRVCVLVLRETECATGLREHSTPPMSTLPLLVIDRRRSKSRRAWGGGIRDGAVEKLLKKKCTKRCEEQHRAVAAREREAARERIVTEAEDVCWMLAQQTGGFGRVQGQRAARDSTIAVGEEFQAGLRAGHGTRSKRLSENMAVVALANVDFASFSISSFLHAPPPCSPLTPIPFFLEHTDSLTTHIRAELAGMTSSPSCEEHATSSISCAQAPPLTLAFRPQPLF